MAAVEGRHGHITEVQLGVGVHGVDVGGVAVEPLGHGHHGLVAAEEEGAELVHEGGNVGDVIPVGVGEGDEVALLNGFPSEIGAHAVGDVGVGDDGGVAELHLKAGDGQPFDADAKLFLFHEETSL